MPATEAAAALAAEADALGAALATLTTADLDRASPCPPWTAGELTCHVIIGARRIAQAVIGPDNPTASLITTVGYYRADERFSSGVNADRIDAAQDLARQLAEPDAIRTELAGACAESVGQLAQAPADRTIRTRHGDWMLLADFARTRVVERGLHGLDLAVALDRPPWLTGAAATVLEDLLLPAGNAARLRTELVCDRAALIALLTGRAEPAPPQAAVLARAGAIRLALGQPG
jgi:uncharacterized protein (TIGR03083 family)